MLAKLTSGADAIKKFTPSLGIPSNFLGFRSLDSKTRIPEMFIASAPVVNFINIYEQLLRLYSFVIQEKLCKGLLYQKGGSKMLVKLISGVTLKNGRRHRHHHNNNSINIFRNLHFSNWDSNLKDRVNYQQ